MGVIKRQGIKNTIITYVGILIGFVSLIFIQPHLLSSSELGLVRILLSFSSFIATILPLGVSNINVRYFPFFKDESKKHHGYFGLMLLFPLVGCVFGSVIIFLFKDFIVNQYIQESKLFVDYFFYVFPLSILIALLTAVNSYAWALYKTSVPSFLSDILNRLLFILVIVLYFLKVIDLNQFVLLFASLYVIQLSILLIYVFIVDKPTFIIDFKFLKQIDVSGMIKYGLLLMLTSMSSISLRYLDSIMIAKFLPLAFVGIYSIAAFISTIIETPLLSMERIATAKIAHAWSINNVEEIRKIYFMSSKYMSLLGGILLIGILTNVNDPLGLLPAEYSGGIMVTFIMSIGAFINMATGVNYSILFNSSKYIYGVMFIVVLLIMTIVGNMIFIPLYGIVGAAIATAFASVVYNLLKFFYIWKVFKMQPFDISMVKILGAMTLCFGINYFLPAIDNHIASIIVRSAGITLVYASATYLMNIVPEFHQYIPIIGKKK